MVGAHVTRWWHTFVWLPCKQTANVACAANDRDARATERFDRRQASLVVHVNNPQATHKGNLKTSLATQSYEAHPSRRRRGRLALVYISRNSFGNMNPFEVFSCWKFPWKYDPFRPCFRAPHTLFT